MRRNFQPAYLELWQSGELARRVEMGLEKLADCTLCPRNCHVNRLEDKKKACRTGRYAIVSSHFALCLAKILSGSEINSLHTFLSPSSCYQLLMFCYIGLWWGLLTRCLQSHRSLLLENLALRQQLAVLKRKHPRPRMGAVDKIFWVFRASFLECLEAVSRARQS